MADTDLIAWIYPSEDYPHRYARAAIEASSRYMPPKVAPQESPEVHWSRSSRESTESCETEQDEEEKLDSLPYLELRFSDVPRTSSGLVFGVDPNTCDIVLPKIPGISRRHFALTYKNKFEDGYDRLIVRDLGSTFGTVVTYNGQGRELRSKFDWIIDGFDVTDTTEEIIVQPHQNLKFRIVVAHHSVSSPTYIDNVDRFRQGAAAAEDLLHGFGLQDGPETERNTGAHTPVENRILLPRGRIAKGGFGVVNHYWNVSTGEEYAGKKPADKRYDRKAWEKEIDIMDRISHEHIVRLCFFEKTPLPVLYLEYMPFGNLEDEHSRAHFSHEECLVILHQGLLALDYLHGLTLPVVHRDIKPENILVKNRNRHGNPEYLHVKLSDFGLSKVGSLKTFCGSRTYCPPEIVRDIDAPQRYTKAVDIWSLGVVVLRYAYGLPYPGSGIGMDWCKKIVEEASSWDSEGLIDLLRRMLVIDAPGRYSAATCLREASRLLQTSHQDRSATPTPASYIYTAGHAETMVSISTEEQGQDEEQETLRSLPHELCSEVSLHLHDGWVSGGSLPTNPDQLSHSVDADSGDVYETRKNIRSNAPPPDSMKRTSTTTRKRTTRTSNSSSSSGRRTNDTGRHLRSDGPPPRSFSSVSRPSRKRRAKNFASSSSTRGQLQGNQLGDDSGSALPVPEQVSSPLAEDTQGSPYPRAFEDPEGACAGNLGLVYEEAESGNDAYDGATYDEDLWDGHADGGVSPVELLDQLGAEPVSSGDIHNGLENLSHDENETEAIVWPYSFHSDIPTGVAYVPSKPRADGYSQYTESNGSYLAPASRSYEELLAKTP